MRDIFSFFSRLLHNSRASRQRQAILDRLRLENPGCSIKSTNIFDTYLGKSVAVLDRTILRQVSIGCYSYVSNDSCLTNTVVGNFCSIGPHVQIGLAKHPTSVFVSTHPAFYSNFNECCPQCFRENKIFDDSVPKTIIGHDVWIGSNTIIPGGIRVGTGAVVASGSVVVKDVPSYAIVGGNPAKVIRLRFSEELIDILMASEWWNWPIEKIRLHADAFSDIEKFKAIAKR